MKKIFKILLTISVVFSTMFLCSCGGDARVSLKADGGVYFEFTGSIGQAFKDMMTSAGNDMSTIDEEGIVATLEEKGFVNIKVHADMEKDSIKISFEDKTRSSYLFDNEIVKVNGDDVSFSMTPVKFLKLYESSGEDIQSLLDLFISPVLNDEVMTEEEYIETLSVTYGEDAGNEISESSVDFTITNKKGNTKTKSIYGKSILCGAEVSL